MTTKSPKNKSLSSSENFFTKGCFCDKKGLSLYINQLMREKNLVGPDVYLRAGISKQTWNHIYSGKNCPTSENARRLLIGLKCTVQEAEEFLLYCGMTFVPNSVYDECLLFCLENHYTKMIDVSLYIYNFMNKAA